MDNTDNKASSDENTSKTSIKKSIKAKYQTRASDGKFVKIRANQSETLSDVESKSIASEKAETVPPVEPKTDKSSLGDSISTLSAKRFVNISQNRKNPTLTGDDPPLVDIEVTNPITYFKKWWKRIIGNEGIRMKWSLEIKPLTAFLLVAFVVSGGITIKLLNKIKSETPVIKHIPSFGSEVPVKRAFSGYLEKSGKDEYFLITSNEVITPANDTNIYLEPFIGKKVLVTGMYSEETKTLKVEEIKEIVTSDN